MIPGIAYLGVIRLFQHLLILGLDLRLMPSVVPYADQRIQQDAKGNEECDAPDTDE